MKCRFEVTEVSNNTVYLLDLDGAMSITNDAESVLTWIKKEYPGHRVIYTDTYGDVTEIVDEPHTTWMGTSPITFKVVEE